MKRLEAKQLFTAYWKKITTDVAIMSGKYRYFDRRAPLNRRLSTRLLARIALWSLAVVVIVATVGFYIAYEQEKASQKSLLINQVRFQIEHETDKIRLAVDTAEKLRQAFLTRYQLFSDYSELAAHFDQWYVETEPGVFRLHQDFFEGILVDQTYYQHVNTFVGPGERPIPDELKARIVISQQVLNDLGPAWDGVWANSHFSMPENIISSYSSEFAWGLLAAADLVITDYNVVKSTLQEFNPQRQAIWTGLYYDLSADYWTITYQLPIDFDGRHLANASHDIPLNTLVSGLVRSEHPESQYFVFNEEGQLVASEESLSDNYQDAGILDIHKLTNPIYAEIYQQLAPVFAERAPVVLPNAIEGQLLIAQPLEVADWWHVTLYPYAEIQRAALLTPLQVSFSAIILLLVILFIVYVFVSRYVADPIQRLAKLSELIGAKQYEKVIQSRLLHEDIRSEIGQLIRAFRAMAQRLLENQNNLEGLVEERTKQLEQTNSKLAQANKKLDQIAHLDGLTNLWNRRAFDRDLQLALQQNEPITYALLLGDIDQFKAYNDQYGHLAGDDALRQVAKILTDHCTGTVYRYGGEEIAILIPVTDIHEAEKLARLLCENVASLSLEHIGSPSGVLTISFGVVLLDVTLSDHENLNRVDKLMYQAKRGGGNQACR
ncbi:MAG: diguanylate cyclase [Aliidiomarina sp.]|uniref:GGDEF domain-containing protein n=1 Tax=Aliidiomarina sp. TaxID=1872439 RepID=UPI0025BE7F90|nr:diguanylate cyclase [Aliidiomarina sp.]MCH8500689.1 diguanylate cyclase [Aliidiomarina sp.]